MKLADFVLDPATSVMVPAASGVRAGYLDGVEGHLLEVLAGAGDRTVGSDELPSYVRDWPTHYHLTPYRATLFDALGFTGEPARVLELGAGCGAVTRWLGENCGEVHAVEGNMERARVARTRCLELDNVSVYVGNYSMLEEEASFDVGTLIGVLEYGHLYHPTFPGDPHASALDNLSVVRRALKSDGVLVLAIENKLGLKYLNGAREDHSGRLYEGIQGYPYATSAVTFSARELEGLLREAGFATADWFLPFPDYKLPTTILNDRLADERHSLHNWIGTPAPDRGAQRSTVHYNEGLAWRELINAGLLRDLANSFLVVAYAGDRDTSVERLGIDTDWVARHWSLDRRGASRKRVTLREQAGEGLLIQNERALGNPEPAPDFVSELIEQRFEREPYRPGDLAIIRVFEALAGRGIGPEFSSLVVQLRDWLLADHAAAGSDGEAPLLNGDALDCSWWNAVIDPQTGDWHAIDREWSVRAPLPADFVVWRTLYHFAEAHRAHLPEPWNGVSAAVFAESWVREAFPGVSGARAAGFQRLEEAVVALVAPGRPDPAAVAPLAELAEAPRAVSVIAFADEVSAEPALLSAFAAEFGADDPATLVLYAPDADESVAAERVRGAMSAAGLDDELLPDMLLLAVPSDSAGDVAGGALAVLSQVEPPAPFDALPRFTAADCPELRRLAGDRWRDAA